MPPFEFYAATLTPFDESGEYLPDAVPALADHLVAQRLDGAYVGGSTGEAPLQTYEERARCLVDFARASGGRVRLTANIGGASTLSALKLAEVAAKAGYQQVAALPPPGVRLGGTELLAYYGAIARSAALPVLVYYFPQQSGASLTSGAFGELLALENVAGVKFTSGDLFLCERLRTRCPDARLYYGMDEQFLFALPLAPHGAIGSTYNVMGPVFQACRAAFLAGDLARAARLQGLANDVIERLLDCGVVAGLKAILRAQGVPAGYARGPHSNPGPDAVARLLAAHRAALAGVEAT